MPEQIDPNSESLPKYPPMDQLDAGMVRKLQRNNLGPDAADRMDSRIPLSKEPSDEQAEVTKTPEDEQQAA